MKPALYESPEHVGSAAQCNFYDTMEIPGVGLVDGPWESHEMFRIVSSRG